MAFQGNIINQVDSFYNPHSPNKIGGAAEYTFEEKLSLASDLNSSAKILKYLSKDEDFRVRSAVAGNPNCPIHILEKLSDDDEDFNVLNALSNNKNCPEHILEKLSNNKYFYVRRNVAKHPNCPVHVLKKLLNYDDDILVERYARENLAKRDILIEGSSIKSFVKYLACKYK